MSNKHIVLLGFKNVGKTLIGEHLAKILEKHFIDLDREIEKHYKLQQAKCLTCRQIMQLHGQVYYRLQEKIVLQKILRSPPAVIALGGGTLLDIDNQKLVKPHLLLYIMAARGIVFERIMVTGRPAFFNSEEDPYQAFTLLWEERTAIYEKMTSHTIDNSSSLEDAISQAKAYLTEVE